MANLGLSVPQVGAKIDFTERDARMAAVRAMVDRLVADVDDRVALLHAVAEYGHAAAMGAADAMSEARRGIYRTVPRR